MNLVASLIVRDELDRYLAASLAHLLGFCDEVRILDDGSTDGWADRIASYVIPAPDVAPNAHWTLDLDRIHVLRSEHSGFFAHEGRARNALLDWTLAGAPTHVLAIDADEFVADGPRLRAACAGPAEAFTLTMQEVWQAEDECLCIRQDGGWHEHPVPILWRVPPATRLLQPDWRIMDRTLACGREPLAVRNLRHRAAPSGTEILHFGWARRAERQARYRRYAVADGGRFHAGSHLASILWDDDRVELTGRQWPAALEPMRPWLLERTARP